MRRRRAQDLPGRCRRRPVQGDRAHRASAVRGLRGDDREGREGRRAAERARVRARVRALQVRQNRRRTPRAPDGNLRG